VLSHTNAVTALNLAQSLNSNIGIETLEGLRAVATLSQRKRRKVLMIQAGSTANVTYCMVAVEFYKYFLQMEGYFAQRLGNVNISEAKDYIFYGR
jgi:hypothetical protein